MAGRIAIQTYTMSLILFAPLASADYYWRAAGHTVVHPSDFVGSSPHAVCAEVASYVQAYESDRHNGGVSAVGTIDPLREVNAECKIKLTGSGFNQTINWSIHRDGTGCESGSYNPHISKCSNGSLLGSPPPSCGTAGNQVGMLFGNPIDFTTGNKIQQEVDLQLGSTPVLVRTYNSLDGLWKHNLLARLHIFNSKSAVLHLPGGKEIPFDTYWTPAKPEVIGVGRLQRQGAGWVYVDFDNSQYFFDATGTYIGGIDAQKNSYSISREGTNLIINYPSLGQFSVDIDEQGNLIRLVSQGYTVDYQYDQGRLVSITKQYADQALSRTYHYEDPRDIKRLTGITDERGIRYATWAYDEQGRAVSSTHAEGADNVSIDYQEDGAVTLTNSLGKKATYRFKTILGSKRVTSIQGEPSSNCPSANSSFEYDAKGLVTKKVDEKGIVTKYTYDSNGRENVRTDAVGTAQERKTTTYWHSYLFLPSQVSDTKATYFYDYDALGNLTSKRISY